MRIIVFKLFLTYNRTQSPPLMETLIIFNVIKFAESANNISLTSNLIKVFEWI